MVDGTGLENQQINVSQVRILSLPPLERRFEWSKRSERHPYPASSVKYIMKTKKGFTILEILVVAVFATLLLVLFFIQKSNIDAMERDEDRKTAINAMYYALEESFYKENGYYPETISEENIKVIDPALSPKIILKLSTQPSGLILTASTSATP